MFLENLEIIVGTYEEFLLGYRPKKVDKVVSLHQTFADHSHTGSVRCASAHGNFLASGGADDSVCIYDMVHRNQSGILSVHKGTVNCIEYTPNGSHLLTGGADGLLAIIKTHNFQVEKLWDVAHKGSAILGISVHPSGKLALTVGADATLHTWNLVKGRKAYGTRLGSSKCGAGWLITGVCWSTTGKFYAVGIASKLDVYSVESAAIVYSITLDVKICSFCFLNDNIIFVGSENGVMYIHDLEEKKCLTMKKAHEQRVKCLKSVASKKHEYVVSASSSGEIKLWEYKRKEFYELSKVTTGCRIICLTIASCGYPNLKEEEEEDGQDVIQRAPVQVLTRAVVVVEEENEEEYQFYETKKKKKKMDRSKSSSHFGRKEEMEKMNEGSMEKQKEKNRVISKTSKLKAKRNKKKRSSLVNSWVVSNEDT